MSKCIRCQVEILDETERCPLCDAVLEKTVEVENMYPDVRVKSRKMSLISKIYLFCAILAEAILVYLNIRLESQIWWCVITGLSLLYVYLGILLVDAVIIVLMLVNIKGWQSYLVWQIFMIICSMVPVLLYLLGIVTRPELTFIAMGCSFFLFLGTFIIGDRRARVELKRRFHVR